MSVSLPLAYPVPFRVERLGRGHLRLTNRSDEKLTSVVFLLDGPGVMPAEPAGLLRPGDRAELRVHGEDLARATAVVVRWARPDGSDYLWRISF